MSTCIVIYVLYVPSIWMDVINFSTPLEMAFYAAKNNEKQQCKKRLVNCYNSPGCHIVIIYKLVSIDLLLQAPWPRVDLLAAASVADEGKLMVPRLSISRFDIKEFWLVRKFGTLFVSTFRCFSIEWIITVYVFSRNH